MVNFYYCHLLLQIGMELNAFKRCHHIILISVILFVLLIIKLEKVIFCPCGAVCGFGEIMRN